MVGAGVDGATCYLEQLAVLRANGVRNYQKMRDLPERAGRQQERQAGGEPAQGGRSRLATSPFLPLVATHHQPDK
jgi:hypothetical protein